MVTYPTSYYQHETPSRTAYRTVHWRVPFIFAETSFGGEE